MKCEICNGDMRSIYRNMGRKEHSEFLKCPSCGLRWAPRLDVDRSFHSKLNEESRQEALSGIREREFAQVNRLLREHVQPGSRGLEVGCAYGWFLDGVGQEFHMEGIEPEGAIAEQAREKGHRVYAGFFPSDMPENVGKYDFLVFNNVWEHINHTSDLIRDSVRFLKDGGMMIITIPLSTGGLFRLAECFERVGRTKELTRLWQLHFHSPHVYFFNKQNIEKVMLRYGCNLITCEDVVSSVDPKRMKERFEMDTDERHGGLKALAFRTVYPILRRLPADKAMFVFQYNRLSV